mmetsp:Transcript_34539/g.64486  ORF Transcript_34539/g.64486 Transcript_34539/m.64486 type:complete len:632 (+) Transcript_34539:111-2006(+)
MGKRPANPRAAEVKRARAQLTEACKEKAVGRVLEIFHECESAQLSLPLGSLAQALSALSAAGDEVQAVALHSVSGADDATAAGAGASELGEPAEEARAAGDVLGRGERFAHARRLFDQARGSVQDWSGQGESIYTLLVRLAARAGELSAAMRYLREMREPPVSIRPKLRTFVPILEACASGGLCDEAEALYRDNLLSACGPSEATAVWSSEEEDRLWQYVFALRLRAWSAATLRGAPAALAVQQRQCLDTILEDITAVCPQLRSDSGLGDALREAFSALNWHVAQVCIGPDGRCPVTSMVLRSLKPCEAELQSLLNLIERLAIENASQRKLDEWVSFKAWLERSDHRWDTVIDGANVGHCNQNFENGAFSHSQIHALLARCASDERRRVALVIRKHWLRPDTDFALPTVKPKKRKAPQLGISEGDASDGPLPVAMAEALAMATPDLELLELSDNSDGQKEELTEDQRRIEELVQEWRKQGVLVVSPPSINDDWVALYIAIAMSLRGVPDVQFVTNDELRDHFWRMRQPAAFQTWREGHTTHYQIFSERPAARGESAEDVAMAAQMSVQLFPPPLYSHRVQHDAEGKCWHFPVRPGEAAAEGDREESRDSPHKRKLEWIVACDRSIFKTDVG